MTDVHLVEVTAPSGGGSETAQVAALVTGAAPVVESAGSTAASVPIEDRLAAQLSLRDAWLRDEVPRLVGAALAEERRVRRQWWRRLVASL